MRPGWAARSCTPSSWTSLSHGSRDARWHPTLSQPLPVNGASRTTATRTHSPHGVNGGSVSGDSPVSTRVSATSRSLMFLYGALVPVPHDRDVVAVAINERFAELGGDHPIRYSNE